MSSQSIVCASCGAAVPWGRLSCPGCGELLASVTGAAPAAVAERAPKRAKGDAQTRDAHTTARSREKPSVLVDLPSDRDGPPWPEDRPATASPAAAAVAAAPVQGPTSGPQIFQPVSPQAVEAHAAAMAPGAYVPPVMPTEPAGPPAPARAWAGHPASTAAVAEDGAPGATSADGLVDPARLTEFLGWLAVAGSAMAAVGFVLPWGISVIGASGVGYFDRWGLAGPFHPLVVLGLLAVLGLALVRNPIPLWIRVGLAGLGLGALLLGLIWPYLLKLPGTGPGVLVVAVGAIILGVAGVVALVTDRHAAEERAV